MSTRRRSCVNWRRPSRAMRRNGSPVSDSVTTRGGPGSSARQGAPVARREFDAEAARHEPAMLDAANDALERMDASQRVEWALEHLPGPHALSSSFGAQAAVSLHLVTRAAPQIPVILVDTGYLFP